MLSLAPAMIDQTSVHKTPCAILAFSMVTMGCSDDSSSGNDEVGDVCETEGSPVNGDWDPALENWQMAGDISQKIEHPDLAAHHPFLTAVHSIHLPTNQVLMYHGYHDERIWDIGSDASTMGWHPIPHQTSWQKWEWDEEEQKEVWKDKMGYPDIFCSGHALLGNGQLLVAGGNVTGSGAGGGLEETFLFNPWDADPLSSPYGWSVGPSLGNDRWYPTLTMLEDGRVLISGGISRDGIAQDTFEVYDPTLNQITQISPTFGWGKMPLYPFMFLLPNGDVLYAGGEDAQQSAHDGHILIPDYNHPQGIWAWANRSFSSSIAGGSAVMYEPGRILKSGGVDSANSDDEAVATTEILDLAGFGPVDYQNAPDFVEHGDMNQRRHFHTLTLLPDGRVLATGGNTRGNGQAGDDPNNACEYLGQEIGQQPCGNNCAAVPSRCQSGKCKYVGNSPCNSHTDCGQTCTDTSDCPGGSTCVNGRCEMPCQEYDWYTQTSMPATCGAVGDHCSDSGLWCDPGNNDCFATKTAEIWDPALCSWTELDAQQKPRMYHSTAFLLPDTRVVSTGGGHRNRIAEQPFTEYFEVDYGLIGGVSPQIALVDDDIPNNEDDAIYLGYSGQLQVQVLNPQDAPVDHFNMVRLSSVTHQFDQGQVFVPLNHSGEGNLLTISGPGLNLPHNTYTGPAYAPRGYYMLFAVTEDGEVSDGHYVRTGPQDSMMFACSATLGLTATESSCSAEPTASGTCAQGAEVQTSVPIPILDPATGSRGWEIVVPAGLVEDPASLSSAELAAVSQRCEAACEAEWASAIEVSTTCSVAGVFATPQYLSHGGDSTLDLILATEQYGTGIFGQESLTCTLGETCCMEFDENLCGNTATRTTAGPDALGDPEEYRIALSAASSVSVDNGVGIVSSAATGSVGYGFCKDGNDLESCPFYLGSFNAVTTSNITTNIMCLDGTEDRLTLSNLTMRLGQPAFGISEVGTNRVGFPAGGMIIETSFDVGTAHFTSRRPTEQVVIGSANGSSFSAAALPVDLQVPCNGSVGNVTVSLTVVGPSDGSALNSPPQVDITTPSTVTCGQSHALSANASDPDGDLAELRWRVDGILMAPGTTSLTFTTGHTVEAVAIDSRGATTTAMRMIQCN